MIAFVRGTVAAASADRVVVDVGGVGLAVSCTPATGLGLQPGERVELATALVVREDAWTLYGFLDPEDREVFDVVQTVTGIGPRTALAMLGTMSADQLRSAVAAEDLVALTKVPGIGRKGAQRLVLELKERLGAPQGMRAQPPASDGWRAAVQDGLLSLGWSAREADRAADAVAEEASAMDPVDIGALLRSALRSLDRT